MSIDNRNLKAGTKLVARYKGKEHTAQVVKTDDGLRYRLEDGRKFKSPSSAGSAVMGGKACNGCPCGMGLHKGMSIRMISSST